jgi:hypothetical protein
MGWLKVTATVAIGGGLTLAAVPLAISAVGFGASGVVAGSIAAGMQGSVIGAGTWFAVMQSVGAAGMAVGTKVVVASVGGGVCEGARRLLGGSA